MEGKDCVTEGDTVAAYEPVKVDGRHERRDRNRVAVLDALLDLIEAGNYAPTIAEISVESGISHRSVFRYFDHQSVLFQEALLHAIARYRKYSTIRAYGRGTFDDRLSAIIDQRITVFAEVAPLIQAARRRLGAEDTLDGAFQYYNVSLRGQVEVQFGAELDQVDPDDRDLMLTAVNAVLSFECFEFLQRTTGSDQAIADTYRALVKATLRTGSMRPGESSGC